MAEKKGAPPAADYFKVKNDWFDALIKIHLPGRDRQCLDFIIRQTYGWNRTEWPIPINDFVAATGINKPHVSRSLKSLKLRKMITVTKNDNSKYLTYSFNKYFNEWIPDISKAKTVTKNGNKQLPKMVTESTKNGNSLPITPILVKYNIKTVKDIHHKSKIKIFDARDYPYLLSQTLLNQIKRNIPNHKSVQNGNQEKTIQRWASDIDKMLRLDNRTVCDIWNMIIWCQYDDFWFKNILSGSKLRKQFDKLSAAITSEVRKAERNKPQHEKLLEVGNSWLKDREAQRQGMKNS
jgi:phage replication O-like protein O